MSSLGKLKYKCDDDINIDLKERGQVYTGFTWPPGY